MKGIEVVTSSIDISVIVPVYRGEKTVEQLCLKLEEAFLEMASVNYELVFVDDRSPDRAWELMNGLRVKYPRLRVLKLARNFGQHAAILAGVQVSRGRFVVVMDCDLQDDPAAIPILYRKIMSTDSLAVVVQRTDRKDSWTRRTSSSLFYWLLSKLARLDFDASVGNFGIYRNAVFAPLKDGFKEAFFYFPAYLKWAGFKTEKVQVAHSARYDESPSSYSLFQRIKLAMSITLSFSSLPLYYLTGFGVLFLSFSTALICWLICGYLLSWFTVPGWASIVAVVLFSSSIIVIFMGIIGLYVAKIYEETKARPKYIIENEL